MQSCRNLILFEVRPRNLPVIDVFSAQAEAGATAAEMPLAGRLANESVIDGGGKFQGGFHSSTNARAWLRM